MFDQHCCHDSPHSSNLLHVWQQYQHICISGTLIVISQQAAVHHTDIHQVGTLTRRHDAKYFTVAKFEVEVVMHSSTGHK